MKKLLLTSCFLASLSISAQRVFTSTGSGDWSTPATWTITDPNANGGVNTVPSNIDDVFVSTSHTVDVSSGNDAVCNNLTTGGSSGGVDLRDGSTLTVEGDVSLGRFDNSLRLFHGTGAPPTLIIKGTITDRRIYLRKVLSNNKWFLISSPFLNAKKSKFLTGSTNTVTNSVANGFTGDGSKTSFASYDDANASGSKYVYTLEASKTSGNLTDAAGYSILLDNSPSNASYTMNGKYHHGATTSVAISDAGNGYNLVGNPYLAYIYANDAANATHNVLLDNNSILDEATIWLWDGDNATWVTVNKSDAAAYHISPTQGFFVKAKTGGGAFTFDKDLETHATNGDVFLKTTNNRFEIDLTISTDKLSRKTAIRYIDNTTTSFDNGYDSSVFGGYSEDFQVYTQLLESTTKNLAIQSLPTKGLETMVVPVGVKAPANSEITFSAKSLNVPAGYNVYLEDKTNNILTRLDEANAAYTTTVTSAITEGRFFIHTSAFSVLSLESELLEGVSIFKTDNSNLRIVGLQQGKVSVSLVNLIGKTVMNSSFKASTVNNIALPKLATGVYIVQLETEAGKLNKKIILE
ncbi:T9SS type A sorting domain-containing protein [Polaribacter butkevichii]|uniref:Secretion system C-terminal sorting domain-containing protein n=1 Tax=Polaribacter butkevichii TaxID=218490 RepID=A0A2P6CCK1_9FLAO|nr:T9SS type A sorting domain-containing protein [Polaribacter butkevichii]PQJ72651.1 hypothetical protein BTO14_04995 [Polaribacter butkevichii]